MGEAKKMSEKDITTCNLPQKHIPTSCTHACCLLVMFQVQACYPRRTKVNIKENNNTRHVTKNILPEHLRYYHTYYFNANNPRKDSRAILAQACLYHKTYTSSVPCKRAAVRLDKACVPTCNCNALLELLNPASGDTMSQLLGVAMASSFHMA